MPWARNRSVRIYWEEEGSGEPLLLIMGLSFSLAMWGELRPFLAQHFRTLLFDNRCVGASSSPVLPFTIASMAEDALAVLDVAGVRRANVLGISMGGMIAQELSLRYPDRVASLILGCTHAGGRNSVRADARVLAALAAPSLNKENKLSAMVPFLYHPNTPRERIENDLKVIRGHAPTLHGFLQQLAAIAVWSAWRRLPRLRVPALILHGDTDLLVPTANAQILAGRIPDAELVILPEAGHIFPTDQPKLTRSALMTFLRRFASAA